MQLDDILANVADQDRGREMELADPFTGAPTGIKLTIAGPDSATSRRARVQLADELVEAADDDGKVSAESRRRARLNSLAVHVLRWDIHEGGEQVPFSTKALLRVLAVQWVEEQVDTFAGDRRNFGPRA